MPLACIDPQARSWGRTLRSFGCRGWGPQNPAHHSQGSRAAGKCLIACFCTNEASTFPSPHLVTWHALVQTMLEWLRVLLAMVEVAGPAPPPAPPPGGGGATTPAVKRTPSTQPLEKQRSSNSSECHAHAPAEEVGIFALTPNHLPSCCRQAAAREIHPPSWS